MLEKQKESIKSGSEIEIIESTKPIQKARTNEVGKVVTDETLIDTAPVLTDKAQEFKDEKEVEVMGESPKKDRVAQNVAASVVSSSSLHELKDAIESLGNFCQFRFDKFCTAVFFRFLRAYYPYNTSVSRLFCHVSLIGTSVS